jgi:4-hydroxyphenylpyruvate dioxygenase
MADLYENPMGLMGLNSSNSLANPEHPGADLRDHGLHQSRDHRSKDVHLYRQGAINLISTMSPQAAARTSRPSMVHRCAAWRSASRIRRKPTSVRWSSARSRSHETGPMELNLPAIKGIGGAPLYLIDRFEEGSSIYDIDFEFIEGVDRNPVGRACRSSTT